MLLVNGDNSVGTGWIANPLEFKKVKASKTLASDANQSPSRCVLGNESSQSEKSRWAALNLLTDFSQGSSGARRAIP